MQTRRYYRTPAGNVLVWQSEIVNEEITEADAFQLIADGANYSVTTEEPVVDADAVLVVGTNPEQPPVNSALIPTPEQLARVDDGTTPGEYAGPWPPVAHEPEQDD